MATIEIFKLFGSILIDDTKANQSLAKTEDRATKVATSIQKLGGGVTKAGGVMAKWVTGPIAAVGGGLFALAQKTANTGDEIQKMALRTGFSTEALSEYRHAAELSGASLETVEKGVKRMQKVIFDAEKGLSTANDAFDALGLSLEDIQGLSPEEQFQKLSGAIADIEDPSRRAALAQEVFGRAGTEMLPMLSAGADGIADMRQEARDLGIVFDQEAADSAAQFNDDMDRLRKSFGGAFQELGTNLIPILVDQLIPAVRDNVVPAIKEFGERVGALIDWFTDLDPKWQKVIGLGAGFLAILGPVLVAVGTMISLSAPAVGALVRMGGGFLKLTGRIAVWLAQSLVAFATFSARMLATAATHAAQVLKMVGRWVFLGAQSLLHAAKVAAAWFIALGPVGWVIATVVGLVALIVANWETVRDTTMAIIGGVATWLSDAWDGIKTTAINAFQSVKDRVLGIWDGIKTGIKDTINGIIGFINRMIRAWNDLSFGVGGGTFLGKKIPRLEFGTPNIPTIPKLQDGGDLLSSGAVLVGERGPELLNLPRGARVTPLERSDGDGETKIIVENMYVRDDSDIKKIARELDSLSRSRSRGVGLA